MKKSICVYAPFNFSAEEFVDALLEDLAIGRIDGDAKLEWHLWCCRPRGHCHDGNSEKNSALSALGMKQEIDYRDRAEQARDGMRFLKQLDGGCRKRRGGLRTGLVSRVQALSRADDFVEVKVRCVMGCMAQMISVCVTAWWPSFATNDFMISARIHVVWMGMAWQVPSCIAWP